MENYLDEEIRNLVSLDGQPQEVLSKFVQRYAASIYPKMEIYKQALLCCAVRNGHLSLVNTLLEDDFSVNMATGPATSRPLHVACSRGDEEMICILLAKGADVNLNALCDTDRGEVVGTAVEAILRHDNVTLLDLVSKGYDVSKSRGCWTLTHLACKGGALKCLDHVLNYRDANVQDSKLRTPLYYAMHHNSQFVRLLLECGADVNIRDREGWGLMYPLLRRFSGAGPDFISQDAPAMMENLVAEGMSLRETNQGETSFRMLCRQISAELLYRNDFNYPYPIETHQAVVKSIAQRLNAEVPLNEQECLQCITYILTSEVGKCCHSFPYWLVDNTYHGNLDKAFSSYSHALRLGRDLISLLLSTLSNTIANVLPENLQRDQIREICGWLESNNKNIQVVPHQDWTSITDVFQDILRLLILQLWTVPSLCPGVERLVTNPSLESFNTLELPILEVLCDVMRSDRYQFVCQVNNKGNEERNQLPVTRSLMASCRIVILNCIKRPRLQRIGHLPLPSPLKSYVALQS